MQINIAGAGAGKTSKMADLLSHIEIPEGKVVFCIAFTNSAVENIEKKYIRKYGKIPDNIKISTIHSFLYQELIHPYYYLVFGKHYQKLSTIPLPNNPAFKNIKITELESQDILHIDRIPERAKWVVYKKTNDTEAVCNNRAKMLSTFAEYCHSILIDEAQDISKDIKTVIDSLAGAGIEIVLYGDPKQDIRGGGHFQKLIDAEPEPHYIRECFRCPQIHLNISNTLADEKQQQFASSENATGKVSIVFESEIDVAALIKENNFGLKYISKKNKRFETHSGNLDTRIDSLFYEVQKATAKKWSAEKSELTINRAAYYVSERMLMDYDVSNNSSAEINKRIKTGWFDYPGKTEYAQMNAAFKKEDTEANPVLLVSSIESVKGLEAENCLFILTTDLAPYLFQENTTENLTKHLLYVALTRSLRDLTILVTREVENKYQKEYIINYLSEIMVS